jgi:hypothetical protein
MSRAGVRGGERERSYGLSCEPIVRPPPLLLPAAARGAEDRRSPEEGVLDALRDLSVLLLVAVVAVSGVPVEAHRLFLSLAASMALADTFSRLFCSREHQQLVTH